MQIACSRIFCLSNEPLQPLFSLQAKAPGCPWCHAAASRKTKVKSAKPTGPKQGRTTYSAPALEKAFNVVELLAKEKKGLTVSEIAVGIGLSLPEIFRIIVVMERRGAHVAEHPSCRLGEVVRCHLERSSPERVRAHGKRTDPRCHRYQLPDF
jgi:hypothetical protein